jgi:hypothetical protein
LLAGEELTLFGGRFELWPVQAYRCSSGHVFLIPDVLTPTEAIGNEIVA